MSQSEKAQFYAALKEAGYTFDRHYREYNTEELKRTLLKEVGHLPAPPVKEPKQESRRPEPEATEARYESRLAYQEDGETPLRSDEFGRIWYREEVRKPPTARPRARRKITYIDPGTTQQTVVDGRYIETVEVAGNESRTSEVKITMPSYQVGVYKDPRFPFKVHVYNDTRGFDLLDIQSYYGGADLVPGDIKRVYIENDLCYDIRSTIRSIQNEYRSNQLRGMQ